MSNIVGEGFPEEIVNQIKERQTIYGSINRNNEQLTYLNSRTGWCKMVSSVNIKKPLRNITLLEAQLAKAFVLFNGTTNEDTNIQRGGIWPGVGDPNSYAYGVGGTAFGLRPMPGIKSATTKTETRGSLRTSIIQIQANNKEQFDIIDVLYLRLGFTMLVEWGNSSYFNKGVYVEDNPNSLADDFLSGKLNYANASKTIRTKCLESGGNYDAIVGKVVNFNWTFTKNGTYEITIILRSMGDVIESLKSNILLPNSSLSTPSKGVIKAQEGLAEDKAELSKGLKDLEAGKAKVAEYNAKILAAEKVLDDEKDALAANKASDSFEAFAKEGAIALKIVALEAEIVRLKLLREAADVIYVDLNNKYIEEQQKDIKQAEQAIVDAKAEQAAQDKEAIAEALKAGADATPEEVIKAFSLSHEIGRYFYQQQLILSELPQNNNSGISFNPSIAPKNFFKQVYEGDNTVNQFYIRLGHFLEWVQDNIIPYIDIDNEEVKLLKIDTDADTNIIYLLGRQISSNPGICIFNTTFPTKSGESIQFAKDTEVFRVSIGKSTNSYGKIMNAYFNMTYILQQLDSLKDEDGKVNLYDLFKSLCDGWNNATGNFSKLGVTVDVDDTKVKFIDEVSLPDRDEWLKSPKFNQKTELATFDVYGYYYPLLDSKEPTGAGFIKDINFTTTVPPNLAMMITAGANADGYVLGQDATALSAMNADLEDRFKKKIETKNSNKTVGTASLNESYKTALDDFNTFVAELGSFNGDTIPKWNQEAIDSFSSTAVQFYEYDQAKQTLEAKGEKNASAVALGLITSSLKPIASPNGGFLPFDLSVTMDGLAGMKVYQKYTIDTDYLPSNYPSTLEFLIKGISNTIEGNQWTTVLESFAIPKNPFGSSVAKGPVNSASKKESRGTKPPFTGNTPNANALRSVLTSLGYTEKGKNISSGGDISSSLLNYATSVLRIIKKQLPNLQVEITAGNDRTHQNLSYTSSHTTGQGLDITISPATTANKKVVDTILGGFAAGNQNLKVSFINEYDYPSKASTGGHFHLRIGGRIESDRIASFIALANRGKLTTYPIV
jgi:hypothetical protein